MRVTSAAFVKSALKLDDCPRDGRPEIAFCGRSNVGKSSLLNTLFRRNGLAKTSKTPGKTQTLNFFCVNEQVYFVDLPGYGFAKVSKSLKGNWNKALSTYLSNRDALRGVCHLIDSRHPPTKLDHEMLDLLEEAERPTILVATKFDKLKANERQKSLAIMRADFGLPDDAVIVPFSSMTRLGEKELLHVIDELLSD